MARAYSYLCKGASLLLHMGTNPIKRKILEFKSTFSHLSREMETHFARSDGADLACLNVTLDLGHEQLASRQCARIGQALSQRPKCILVFNMHFEFQDDVEKKPQPAYMVCQTPSLLIRPIKSSALSDAPLEEGKLSPVFLYLAQEPLLVLGIALKPAKHKKLCRVATSCLPTQNLVCNQAHGGWKISLHKGPCNTVMTYFAQPIAPLPTLPSLIIFIQQAYLRSSLYDEFWKKIS